MLQYRHEWKHEIGYLDLLAIRARLKAVAQADAHAVDGKYLIRSLYFDNAGDKTLREKLDGVNQREKFRIRYYNGDTSVIHLEKKSKLGGLGTKFSAGLTAREAQAIVDGETGWMMDSPQPLVRELYCKMRSQGLRPKTIVDYTREPFVYAPGNVRVTFDYDIRTGLASTDFLNPDCPTVPAGDAPIILEVTSNVVLSLGMVGALSIVRFRTAIKEPLDIAFLFWSIAAGIVLAAGMISLAVFGSVIIGVILLLFVNRKSHFNPYIVVIQCDGSENESKAMAFLNEKTNKCAVKSKTAQKSMIELNCEVRLKDENTDFINALADMQGVSSAVLVSYNGDYMG